MQSITMLVILALLVLVMLYHGVRLIRCLFSVNRQASVQQSGSLKQEIPPLVAMQSHLNSIPMKYRKPPEMAAEDKVIVSQTARRVLRQMMRPVSPLRFEVLSAHEIALYASRLSRVFQDNVTLSLQQAAIPADQLDIRWESTFNGIRFYLDTPSEAVANFDVSLDALRPLADYWAR